MTKASQDPTAGLIEWRNHGLNVIPATLGMTLVAIHPYALGVMMKPLEDEFGWSRAEISAGPLVTSVVALCLAVFGGKLVDSLGPRQVALVGVPFYAISLALVSTSGPSLTSWLVMYALLAVALVSVYPSVWTAAIAQRFEKSRGLALAIVLSGTGIASAIVPYLGATLIEAYGWRGAYMGMGALSFIVVFPLVLMLFAKNDAPIEARSAAVEHRSSTSAELISPKFLRLAIAGVIYSLGATGLGINAVPILMEEGFSLIAAAEIVGLIGIGTITGRIAGGFLLDFIDGRFIAIGCAIGALTTAVILLTTEQSTMAASVACLTLGITAGAEYDACAYLTTRHFSRRHFAALFGLLGGLFGFTSGIAPFIANSLYGVFGDYDAILIGVIPMFLFSSILFLSLGRYPKDAEVSAQD
ncbi:MAG: MFS transporter [Halieaceae bacterium]|nr:MFS transporter [Halieaceae bacterium]